jgi:hypothetical protein
MLAIIALVFSSAALASVIFQVSLSALRRSHASAVNSDALYLNSEVLVDSRSFLQSALRTLSMHLESGTDESRVAAQRVVRLLSGSPVLAASVVLSDSQLSKIEEDMQSGTVWIVTSNEAIEFAYPTVGGQFSSIIESNIARGVDYHYLVIDSPKARERRISISEDFPHIGIRLLDPVYWNEAARAVDEYVIYSVTENEADGYYLYPASNPRRWIKMDPSSAVARLHDAEAQWSLSEPGRN